MGQFLTWLVIPLLVIICAIPPVYLSGFRELAWVIAYPGTMMVVFTAFAFVVFKDSRKRWPDDRWYARLVKVLTFTR